MTKLVYIAALLGAILAPMVLARDIPVVRTDGQIVMIEENLARQSAAQGLCRLVDPATQPVASTIEPERTVTVYMNDRLGTVVDLPISTAVEMARQGLCRLDSPYMPQVSPYSGGLVPGPAFQPGGVLYDPYRCGVEFRPMPPVYGGQYGYPGGYTMPGAPIYGADLLGHRSGCYRRDAYGNILPSDMGHADGVRLSLGGSSRRYDPPPFVGRDGRIYIPRP